MLSVKRIGGLAAAVFSLSAIAAAAALGRKMTIWKDPKERNFTVSANGREVTLEADPKTTAPGSYGLILSSGHIVVGKVLSQNADGKVTREILKWEGPTSRGSMSGVWTGQVSSSPHDLGLEFEEIQLGQDGSGLPAWIFSPGTPCQESVWAIHIHGLRSSRYSMLRSVPSAAKLGMISLVPSFHGDAENHSNDQVCHYGSLESVDVEKAIAFAVENGAQTIYLFGWSMGATISLLLTEKSQYRHLIAGLVLVSPGPNTEAVIAENARAAGLPGKFAELVPRILSTPLLSRLASLTEPVDFKKLDWSRAAGRLRVPALVFHSRGDTEVPFALTADFAQANRDLVTLVEFPPVPHQCEWNSSPNKFEADIASWVVSGATTGSLYPARTAV